MSIDDNRRQRFLDEAEASLRRAISSIGDGSSMGRVFLLRDISVLSDQEQSSFIERYDEAVKESRRSSPSRIQEKNPYTAMIESDERDALAAIRVGYADLDIDEDRLWDFEDDRASGFLD